MLSIAGRNVVMRLRWLPHDVGSTVESRVLEVLAESYTVRRCSEISSD